MTDRRPTDQLTEAEAHGGPGPDPRATLRFGVNLGRGADAGGQGGLPGSAAREAEDAGFDVVTVADHLGSASPLVALAAAAAVTERVRLRTYTLNAGFHTPALLARDAAQLDAISDGRLDLGLGTGYARAEHEDAGLPFGSHAERVARLESTIVELRRRWAGDHVPAPVQQPVPVLVGAWGERALRVAARHAELVGLSGLTQVPGASPGTFTLATEAETADRVGLLGDLVAAERDPGLGPPVLDALLQRVVVGRDPEAEAVELSAALEGRLTPAELLSCPFVLFAEDAEAGAAELRRRTRRFGITQWMTHAAGGDALASVARAARGPGHADEPGP